jgi:hypothetical protein
VVAARKGRQKAPAPRNEWMAAVLLAMPRPRAAAAITAVFPGACLHRIHDILPANPVNT